MTQEPLNPTTPHSPCPLCGCAPDTPGLNFPRMGLVRNPVLLQVSEQVSGNLMVDLITSDLNNLLVKVAASFLSPSVTRKEVVTKQATERSNNTLSLPSLTPLLLLFKSGSFGLHLPCPVPQTAVSSSMGTVPWLVEGGGSLKTKGTPGLIPRSYCKQS